MTLAYPTQAVSNVIFIIDEPRSSCDTCPVAEKRQCNGRFSTKAKLTAERSLTTEEWSGYLAEIKANCRPRIIG